MSGARPASKVESHLQANWRIRRRIPGAFQDLAIHDMLPGPEGAKTPQFYADAAVVAYRRASSDLPLEKLQPKMTASGGTPDFTMPLPRQT